MSPTRLERQYQTLDYTRAKHEGWLPLAPPITILAMRYVLASVIVSFLIPVAFAQTALSTATVPITLDHNRIIIDVRFPMADGRKKRVRAWVDNGDPEMEITAELAKTLGLHGDPPAKNTEALSVQPPQDIIIGGMRIHPYDVKEAKALVGRASIAPGSSAEINVPSTVLRHYDVVVDYLNRELTIAAPGTVHFEGDSGKTIVNAQNGLIQVATTIGGEKQNLGLDLGSSWSFLSSDVVTKLEKANPQWPRMVGAVGSANMWGQEAEARWELLRIPSMQYGPITVNDVGTAALPAETVSFFAKRVGVPTAGLIGANALL